MAPADAGLLVEVVHSPGPRQVSCVKLTLPQGTTVAQAVQISALAGDALPPGWHVGVWGRKSAPDALLRDGDRVEIYRPLKVDPKEARRVRYRAHGEKLPKGIHRSPKGGTQG